MTGDNVTQKNLNCQINLKRLEKLEDRSKW